MWGVTMQAIKAYYDGKAFVPLSPIRIMTNQSAIVTILDEEPKEPQTKPHEDYFGVLSDKDYNEISEALLETQRVDKNEW